VFFFAGTSQMAPSPLRTNVKSPLGAVTRTKSVDLALADGLLRVRQKARRPTAIKGCFISIIAASGWPAELAAVP
jgi:hypothetical protein